MNSSALNTRAQSLIDRIECTILRHGADGRELTWFHPRPCVIPESAGPRIFMTLQTISGMDYFGPLQWMETTDLGLTWTAMQSVPSMGHVQRDDGVIEAAIDVVPEYHSPTRSVLALGMSMFYRDGKYLAPQPSRFPVYAVHRNGQWSEKRRLHWDDLRGSHIYTNNNGQRVITENGDVCFMLTFGTADTCRSAAGVRCKFDGEQLVIDRVGPEITHPIGRGILEPSLTRFAGRFFATIRTEDQRGYVMVSDDGLNFTPKIPWCWDDGTPIDMSTTQQHWLNHSDGLFLVYTRRDSSNEKVIRWRAPMFIAQVDPRTLRLIRDTERIVFPIRGDAVRDPLDVQLFGNHHTVSVNAEQAWVLDGGVIPQRGYVGDLHMARIRWARPDRHAQAR